MTTTQTQTPTQSNTARRTQCRFILQHLVKQGPISQKQAEQIYAVWRLAAVIRRLKQPPFQITIETQMQSAVNTVTGKPCRYAVYSIPDAALIDANLIYQQPFFRGQIVRHKTLTSSRILKVKSIIFDSAINKAKFKAFGTSQVFSCESYEALQ